MLFLGKKYAKKGKISQKTRQADVSGKKRGRPILPQKRDSQKSGPKPPQPPPLNNVCHNRLPSNSEWF